MKNAEAIKEWVAELRSGKYQQGKRLLRSADDEYCCLGVLCELAVKHGVIGPAEQKNEYSYGYGPNSEWFGALPPKVAGWAGLRHSNGSYYGGNGGSLTDLNDGGTSFAEIADVIESEPEGLFKEGE